MTSGIAAYGNRNVPGQQMHVAGVYKCIDSPQKAAEVGEFMHTLTQLLARACVVFANGLQRGYAAVRERVGGLNGGGAACVVGMPFTGELRTHCMRGHQVPRCPGVTPAPCATQGSA